MEKAKRVAKVVKIKDALLDGDDRPKRDVDKLTKDELIELIRVAQCKKLAGLPLDAMTKADIIDHLKESCCPVLARLTKI